ncbi:MAG: cyanophycinase [Halofilum sp. (in: g-proteobacteria)]|nr:cyanophycinase [Halofilum sp. (in: g-proteobacteria)]
MTNDPDDQYGTLIAIGGAEDREQELEVLSKVFSFTPEASDEVTVIATASGVPEEILPVYEEAFQRIGASKVHSLSVRERKDAADPANIELIQRSGVVFFTGGDQLRLTNILGGSDMLKAIRNHYANGGVIAGTSAGAVAQSTTMIYNGGAADALHKGAVKMSSGLGFVEGIIIDSHFLERGRFTRLMEVGATNPEYLGVGLGEDAAVIIHRNRVLEAIGNGHVIIVDTRDLASSNIADLAMGEAVAIENVVMHALISGHGFDIDARKYLEPEALQTKMREAE